jgi:hypothetical protein
MFHVDTFATHYVLTHLCGTQAGKYQLVVLIEVKQLHKQQLAPRGSSCNGAIAQAGGALQSTPCITNAGLRAPCR